MPKSAIFTKKIVILQQKVLQVVAKNWFIWPKRNRYRQKALSSVLMRQPFFFRFMHFQGHYRPFFDVRCLTVVKKSKGDNSWEGQRISTKFTGYVDNVKKFWFTSIVLTCCQRSRSLQGQGSLSLFWLLCKCHLFDSHQTWYWTCLHCGDFIHDLEVKVVPRSKVETGNTSEWLAILFHIIYLTLQEIRSLSRGITFNKKVHLFVVVCV